MSSAAAAAVAGGEVWNKNGMGGALKSEEGLCLPFCICFSAHTLFYEHRAQHSTKVAFLISPMTDIFYHKKILLNERLRKNTTLKEGI